MKKVPKLLFKKMSLEENIDTIKWAYYENNGLLSVHNYTVSYFPELADLDEKLSKEEVYIIIEDIVKKDYEKYTNRLQEETERYNKLWIEYNDSYFEMLSDYLEIEWPKKEIEAKVGLIPVFPRYLDEFSFSVGTGIEDWKVIETCAHETLHFLWFEKWKKLFPKTPRRYYDSPYIEWEYSEIVTDPILNNKPFNKLFDFEEKGYNSFYKMYDGEELVIDKLRDVYSEETPINEKIVIGFDYLKKYNEEKKIKELDYLIQELIDEDKALSKIKIPNNLEDKKALYRGLRNIRKPKKISSEYLKKQDKYLQEEIENKGIIDEEDISYDKGILSVWKGDITTLKCDAIVNACNEYLLGCFVPGHNCIDNAIHSFAGIQLREECNEIMKGKTLSNGEVILTKGYNLPSKYVIQTVGPAVRGRLKEQDVEDLKKCYYNALKLSQENGIKTIAFPCISTGLYGFPKEEACKIAIDTVTKYLNDNNNSFNHIIFNVFKDEDYLLYKNSIN